MLQTWIVTFVLGVLMARTTPVAGSGIFAEVVAGTTWPALLAFFALAFAAGECMSPAWRPRWILGVVAAAGLLWGLGHAAPFPLASDDLETPATVIKVASSDTVGGPILVRLGGGAIYETYGLQQPGAIGTVASLPSVRLFGATRGTFRVAVSSRGKEARDTGFLAFAREWVRAVAAERSMALTPFYRRWLAGLVMGERTALPVDVREAFRRTGLFHLLVVSGLHVSLMALLLAALLRAPAHLAYSLRLIGPTTWRHAAALLQVLGGGAALLYLSVTGSSAAAQRSALLFFMFQLSAVFFGTLRLDDRLRLAAAAQILVFPVGFVGEATLMSWAAYLLVLRPEVRVVAGTTWRARLFAILPIAVRMQVGLTVLVAAVFGQLALIGLAANLILIPAFPVLLISGLLALAWPELPILSLLLAFQRSFIAAVRLFDGLCDWAPWLSLPPDDLPLAIRVVCVGLSAWILLNTCRDLSIRPQVLDTQPLGESACRTSHG